MPNESTRQNNGIDQGVADLLAHDLARLGVVGEPLEDLIQLAGLLACRNRGAVDFRKSLRKIPQSISQRVAFNDLAAHAEHNALHSRLLGLFGDGLQGLLEGQTRSQQRRQLTGQHRQIQAG